MRLTLAAVLLSVGAAAFADDADPDRKAFQGTWTIVQTKKGDPKDKEPVTASTVVFEGNTYRIKAGDKVVEEGTFTVDGKTSPKQIEVTATQGVDKGKKWHGIYEIDADSLKAVVGPTDQDRPTRYGNPPEGVREFVLKREKK